MTSKRDPKRNVVGALTPHLLAAAVMAATLSLAACDSPVADATKKAQTASNRAARISQSAGEIRPTKEFTEAFKGKDFAEQDKKAKEIIAAITADKQLTGPYKTYFMQRTVAQDLKIATDLLSDAIKMPEFAHPGLKGAIHEQLGTTAVQQAHTQMIETETKLNRMVTMALDLQASAAYINGLGIEADVQEKRAQGATQGLAQASMNIDEARAAAAKAQEVVTGLEKQIEDLRKKAADIYAETDSAMAAAETMRGTAAIEHSKKAVERRKEADSLTADATNLQPTLARAKAELTNLNLQKAQAEAQVAAAEANAKEGANEAQLATQRAAALRAQAKDLIEGEKGLRAHYKEFASLAADVQKEVDIAASSATTADNAFKNALGQIDPLIKKVQEMNLEAGNPLEKVVGSREARAILQLNQAVAKEEFGRANLMGHTLDGLQNLVNEAMATAAKAARIPSEAPATAPSTKKYAADALAAFEQAAQLAESARAAAGTGATPIRWLALTLKSVALHGAYSAGNGADPRKLEEAQAAARAAREENPFLPLHALAGEPAAPANQ